MFNAHIINDVEEAMKKIGVSEDGIEIMREKGKFYGIKLEDIPLKAALLLKQEALAADMECALPWCTAALKCDTTDAILFGTERQFEILIEKMKKQPFKGKIIAEEMEESIENYRTYEFEIKARNYRINVPPVKIMGILNVTPDSFSDGGKYYTVENAVKRVHEMVREGADIIDIGGESSRPFSSPVSEEEELGRIIPVLENLDDLKVPISIDTYKPRVAEEALKRGASIVNDIYGLRKEGMAEVIKDYDAAVVIMHMKGEPKNMQLNPTYEDTVADIIRFLRNRIEFAISKGIEEDKIIIDPGIGFGKRVEDNLVILKNLNSFKSLGKPILIGTSRKSFIGKILNLDIEERLEGTIASNIVAVLKGASIVRVHDVKENIRAIKIAEAIMGASI
ncbi:MAG: dihydropteroate synthase [Thermoplasmata archaeon]|nr:dihydropteroate synthase [Thermoplasmata archaeon]